jgi:hypothetical protein
MNVKRKTLVMFTSALILLAAVLMPAATAVGAELPAVLKEMPTDAMVVAACRSLSDFSQKIGTFVQKLGIMPPEAPPVNIEQMLSGKLGLADKIDGAGSFGLCILDVMAAEKTLVVFVPVHNATEAMKGLNATAVEGVPNVFKANVVPFLKPAGKYILLGGNAEILTSIGQMPKGVKLNPAAHKLFAESDVAAAINLTTLMPIARGMIMGEVMGNEEIQKHPSFLKIINMAMDRMVELQGAAVGGLLGDKGISLKYNIQAAEGSTLAKYLSNHPTTDVSGLAAVPDGRFFIAGTYKFDPRLLIDPVNAIIDAVAADASLSEKVDAEALKKLKSVITRLYSLCGSVAQGSYLSNTAAPPSGAMPNMTQINSYQGNVGEITDMTAKMCPLLTDILNKAGLTLPIIYKSNAGEADGLSYDEMSVDLSKLPLPPDAIQALSSNPMFMGTAMKWYLCKSGSNKLISAMNPSLLGEGAALVKSGSALSNNADITEVVAELPSQANSYTFIHVGNYIQFAASMMQAQMQAQMQMQTQGNQRPNPMMGMISMMGMMFSQIKGSVGACCILTDGGVNMEVFVPHSLIQNVANTAKMMMGGMMGGMGQPGGQPGCQPGGQPGGQPQRGPKTF